MLVNWRMKMIKAVGGRLARLAMLANPLLKKLAASLAVGMVGVFIANGAVAFVPNGEVSKVVRMYMYDDSLTPITVVQLESGAYCYVSNGVGENKKVLNLLLALSISEKKGEFFCYDTPDPLGGFPGGVHKIHRITPV